MLPSSSRSSSGGCVVAGGDDRMGVSCNGGKRGDEDEVGVVRVDVGVDEGDDKEVV